MQSLTVKQQVKINHEQLQNLHQDINYKEEISANTEPPQEIKIKLQTKLPYEQKQEPIQYQEQLQTNNFLTQSQQHQIRQPNLKRRRRALSHHDRIEDVRLVAGNFIEYGLNFRKFNQFYPDIDAKFYRNTVQAINNTAINQIQKFLRYQCNIQIEKLNRDQKRSIRTQLTKVREWLGKKDMGQLQTLYKFIQRKYELIDVEISIEEALKLYKTILQIVKSPFVDVMQDNIKPQTLDPEVSKMASKQERQMQQRTLIFLYIQHRNLTKVSDLLCEKFGYTIKWSKHAVKQKIKFLLRSSLKKLIGSVEAYDKDLKLFFSESQECVDVLIKNENSINLKVFLLGFYLQKTISLIQLRQYIKSVNKFFIQEYKGHGQYECKQFEQNIKIPKLELKGADQQKILLEDEKNMEQVQKNEDQPQKLIKLQKDFEPNEEKNNKQGQGLKQKKKKNEAVLQFEECFYSSEFNNDDTHQKAIKLQQ